MIRRFGTRKRQRLDKILWDGYHKFSEDTMQRHNIDPNKVRLEKWLREKAHANSVARFGEKESIRRKDHLELINQGRKKDRRERTYELYGEWEISFDAGLKRLNKFYGINLLNLIRSEKAGKRNFRILEIGTGVGKAAKEIVKALPGVRYTATGLARVPEWRRWGGSKKIKWMVLHSLQLEKKIKPNSVDFIHSNLGISYNTPGDLTKTLQQCRTILRKGGKILFTSENRTIIPRGFKKVSYHRPANEFDGGDYTQHIYLLEKI
ncbi:Uncharacterised protein [uncultured archaeon]|nr:Uncharacterised protein [uncultured archaeon]